ncbi:ATP-dependent DNA helicase II subunit 1 [Glutinoglossum americanum]|uniref:ATP-dependent DNA helicase II subunit 1 n=1 Tax=Glutinoglossum americanum TaxID=1670608 RepID=A0A9P8L1N2_9PEZI|nr:ATP-dependent DNA helicase II subunit 1 [Glutinoglossum americanum]
MAEPDRRNYGENEEEDEDEVDETGYKTTKDAILFAIDVSPSMLTVPPSPSSSKKGDQDSPTLAALKCAYHLMQQRIISNPNDMLGILLFGTEKSKFEGGEEDSGKRGLAYPHCYLLTELNIPAAEDVKRLKSLAEDKGEFKKLMVPSKESVSMANVLFWANQIFTIKAPNFTSRRLFIITDNDNPHAQDKALRSASVVRAKDLYDLGVTIELFPISRPERNFDRTKFYDDIIYRSSLIDLDAPASTAVAAAASTGNGISLLNSLLSSINSKSVARRALFANLPLEIGPGFKISVKGYILFKRQEPARSCYVWLNGEKAQIVKGSTTQIAEDTARPIEKPEIKKAYKFGGEQVTFTPEEIKDLRNLGDPVIRIVGFKPLSMLPIWASLKQSTFIYPSEEDVIGSTRVFSALHQKLLKDGKMGIVWFIARKNAAPVIAAMIPGAERLGEHGEQVLPPGMWLIPLPYADDIRRNPETAVVTSPDSLIDMMRTVVQQLQLPKGQYNPERYPNPGAYPAEPKVAPPVFANRAQALQWHYRILQAMALEEDLPEQPEDKTIPKHKQIHKRAGEYVLEWGRELEQQFHAWQKQNGTGAKRAANDDNGSLPNKKAKTPSGAVLAGSSSSSRPPPLLDDEAMRTHWKKNTVDKLTVPALKNWMESKNLTISGKKLDLVERVDEYFESKS